MTVSDEAKVALVEKFRQFAPRDLAPLTFSAGTQFFEDFELFKLPLIAYMSDKVESALLTVSDDVSEEFLMGFVDGVINVLRLVADVKLNRQEGDPNGAQ